MFLLISTLTIVVTSSSALSQFSFHHTPATYDVASQTCAAGGQVLAHISSVQEASAFANYFLASGVPSTAAWIGVTRVYSSSRFVDELTRNIFFRNSEFFRGNNPDTNGFEDCVGIVTSNNFGILGAWDDFACTSEFPFACSGQYIHMYPHEHFDDFSCKNLGAADYALSTKKFFI
eukprot:c53887_g1_i1.p1 GENE.c53887_g1_i1~~c53887_g1_i1.p1  ORF type:complete len:176 (+),score=24.87 c53887_g1_i1:412-939(+)